MDGLALPYVAHDVGSAFERDYLLLLRDLYLKGDERIDRTGVGTRSLFARSFSADLSQGFPLLTTKKLHLRSIIHELLWIIRGDTNIRYLQENGVTIWDEWADEKGNLGPIYGAAWRRAPGRNGETVDQLDNLLTELKRNPASRRMIVNAWIPSELPHMALTPCHCMWQVYVAEEKLHMQLSQRSCDFFLGAGFNWPSYALLLHMIAQVVGLQPGMLTTSYGDVHLYLNHLEQAKEQVSREPRALPKLLLNPDVKSLYEFRYEDIAIENYDPHPAIKAPVAV